ncbi:MAG: hypothetical protein GDA44_11270 [Prochloron sp. SP5CPC1]|nr:hypothetical protein [Candidatus Paraprochloron terpiosi SP5CPC1]
MNIWDFKRQWVQGYADVIREASRIFDIPAILLAGIAYMEVGGEAPIENIVAYNVDLISTATTIEPIPPDQFWQATSPYPGGVVWGQARPTPEEDRCEVANDRTVGDLSIAVRRAGESLCYPSSLGAEESNLLVESLQDHRQNVFIAAKHLSDLRDVDFPGRTADSLSRDEIMVIAGRYNRGPELPLDELTPLVRGYGQRVMRMVSTAYSKKMALLGFWCKMYTVLPFEDLRNGF